MIQIEVRDKRGSKRFIGPLSTRLYQQNPLVRWAVPKKIDAPEAQFGTLVCSKSVKITYFELQNISFGLPNVFCGRTGLYSILTSNRTHNIRVSASISVQNVAAKVDF